MIRRHCAMCLSEELEQFLDLGKTPVANTYPTDAMPRDETLYPLGLLVCTTCWFVQQTEIVNDATLYEQDYGFYSSASLPKVAYHQELARRLITEHPDLCYRGIVEIASNDGDLLRNFSHLNMPLLGIDPAEGPSKKAQEWGIRTHIKPFTSQLAREILTEQGPAGVVIANHVIAHVSNLHDVMTGIAMLLDTDGIAIVEVQYLPDLLIGNQLDHVYHEHRYHFSLDALQRLAFMHGLYVNDVRHTPAQSGSISVTMSRSPCVLPTVTEMFLSEKWLRKMSAYESMQDRAQHIRFVLQNILDEELEKGHRIAGYAAPAKATTLINWCEITDNVIEYVIDSTPAKAGRYIPGTNIPIVGRQPELGVRAQYDMFIPSGRELPDTYLLFAWNYLGNILARERRFMEEHAGSFIVPIPVPVLI